MLRLILNITSIIIFPYLLTAQVDIKDSIEVDKSKNTIYERLPKIYPNDILKGKYIEIDTVYDSKSIRKAIMKYPDFKKWMFAIEGGIGSRIAQDPAYLPDDLTKYRRGLKAGLCFGSQASFFLSPHIAVGLNYSLFSINNETDFMSYEEPESHFFTGSRSDDIIVHFFGPTFTIRTIPKSNKIFAWYDFMLGYSTYFDEMNLNGATYNFAGNSFGFSSSVGADFVLSRDFAAGVALRLSAASVKKLKANDSDENILKLNNIDNLSRISLVLILKTFR